MTMSLPLQMPSPEPCSDRAMATGPSGMSPPLHTTTTNFSSPRRFQQFHELLTKQQPQPHVRWAVLATMQRLMTSQDPDDALDDAMAAFNKVLYHGHTHTHCSTNVSQCNATTGCAGRRRGRDRSHGTRPRPRRGTPCCARNPFRHRHCRGDIATVAATAPCIAARALHSWHNHHAHTAQTPR